MIAPFLIEIRPGFGQPTEDGWRYQCVADFMCCIAELGDALGQVGSTRPFRLIRPAADQEVAKQFDSGRRYFESKPGQQYVRNRVVCGRHAVILRASPLSCYPRRAYPSSCATIPPWIEEPPQHLGEQHRLSDRRAGVGQLRRAPAMAKAPPHRRIARRGPPACGATLPGARADAVSETGSASRGCAPAGLLWPVNNHTVERCRTDAPQSLAEPGWRGSFWTRIGSDNPVSPTLRRWHFAASPDGVSSAPAINRPGRLRGVTVGTVGRATGIAAEQGSQPPMYPELMQAGLRGAAAVLPISGQPSGRRLASRAAVPPRPPG